MGKNLKRSINILRMNDEKILNYKKIANKEILWRINYRKGY